MKNVVGGGGGQSFLWYSLLTVILSAGGISDAIQMKPFEQHMTLFIYLSHFKMKFKIIQILTIEEVTKEFYLVVLNCDNDFNEIFELGPPILQTLKISISQMCETTVMFTKFDCHH